MTVGGGARRWGDSFDPVVVRVRCGDAVHRVTWRRGKLVLEDHDLTAERSLAVLGGADCPCMAILRSWSGDDADWAQLLDRVRAIEGPTDPGGGRTVAVLPSEADFRRTIVLPGNLDPSLVAHLRAQEREMYRQAVLYALPPALRQRFLLGAVMRAGRRWERIPPDVRVDAERVVTRRVRHAVSAGMRSWRRLEPRLRPFVEVTLVPPSGKRSLSGWIDHAGASAAVALPVSWLTTVWARGAALVDGCFVLEAVDGRDGVEADVVRWERVTSAASEPITVPARLCRERSGQWHVRWS